ncbi:MAG: type IX secretion system membrane protein PorP/SprF [Bacteroidales bacterium]
MAGIWRTIVFMFFLISTACGLKAQDPQFSQFYANPLYLAPSFAGLTDGSRISANYRNQWPQLPGKFTTYTFSYDHWFDNYDSGAGILMMQDMAGSGNLRTTNIGVQYSYDFPLNNEWQMRPGVHFFYTERAIDFDKLVFNDQITPDGRRPTTIEIPPLSKRGGVDFSTSALAYSEAYWFGFAVDHLLRPNHSLFEFEGDDASNAFVPVKYSLFGGTKFSRSGRTIARLEESVQLAFLYRQQGPFNQLDLGLYWYRNPLVVGAWFRGIPGLSSGGQDAVIFLLGYKVDQFNIGYSFDFPISHLLGSTGGAHEISITYSWTSIRIPKKPRMVPCPEF